MLTPEEIEKARKATGFQPIGQQPSLSVRLGLNVSPEQPEKPKGLLASFLSPEGANKQDLASSLVRQAIGTESPTESKKIDKESDVGFGGQILSSVLRGFASIPQTLSLPGQVIKTAILTKDVQKLDESRERLAEGNLQLIKEARALPDGDARKTKLNQQVQENFQVIQDLNKLAREGESKMISPKQALGVAGEAATVVASSAFSPTKVIVNEGFNEFLKTAGLRALQTGSQFGGFTAANDLKNNKTIGNTIKDTAISLGAGALGSGLFSLGKLSLFKIGEQGKDIFKSGLGFTKAQNKQEIRTDKSATDILIKEGGGTADQLKTKYETAIDGLEKQLTTTLSNSNKSYSTKDVLSQIEEAVKKVYGKNLSDTEIKSIVFKLPIDLLKRQESISAQELNDVRRGLTNLFLRDNNFLKTESPVSVNAAKNASQVMSELVKSTDEKVLRPLFEKYSAYIKGLDSAINVLSSTKGPISTGAKLAGAAVGGGTGAAIGAQIAGPLGAAIGGILGVGTEVLAQSTFGRTHLGNLLNKMGLKVSQAEMSAFGSLLSKLGIIGAFNPND